MIYLFCGILLSKKKEEICMKNKEKKRFARIAGVFLVAFLSFLVIAAIAFGVYLKTHFESELPSDFLAASIKGESPKFFAYRFEDRSSREGEAVDITEDVFFQKRSVYTSIEEIPKNLINAFVAIEDKRFWEHEGVDWYRTLAAGMNYFLGFSKRFGASTITQQLVKNVTGNTDATPRRKLQEILYAKDLEKKLEKKEILELYLNVIHFSDRCDGVGEAAWHYFSKEPRELTLTEAAAIAAITNNPTYYNPIRNPQNNAHRRGLILSAMLEQGYITQDEYEAAVGEPLVLRVKEMPTDQSNSWYVDMVIEDVINGLMEKHGMTRTAASRYLYGGGLRIYTAMDERIQGIVEDYYENAVRVLKNENGISAQSALIVIDAKTGDVLGVAGAVGKKSGNRVQNFATQTLRPPGSTIKPLSIYAPALEKGLINWASVYDDVPVNFGSSEKSPWPKNATGVYRGLTNISYAVAHSTNTVSVRVLEELGLKDSYRFAKEKFRLEHMISDERGNDCDVAALALGQLNYGVTLRELTAAYTAFADRGNYHPYRSYYRVLDADGGILLSNADASEPVMSEGNAAIMTKLLQEVVHRGTSSSITLEKQTECAGKTGTTHNDFDRWFIGYTPQIICGVWCGYEYPEPLIGKNLCTSIWDRVMGMIFSTGSYQTRFEVPDTVIQASYCRDSGKLMGEACAADPRGDRAEIGYFLKGTEPQELCDRHILCYYDVEHGGVFHGNCPVESVKKVGLIQVNRKFPIQILVTDAEYVYHGDPLELPVNENSNLPYFSSSVDYFCGISPGNTQFNRSCNTHLYPSEKSPWEYWFPYFFGKAEKRIKRKNAS